MENETTKKADNVSVQWIMARDPTVGPMKEELMTALGKTVLERHQLERENASLKKEIWDLTEHKRFLVKHNEELKHAIDKADASLDAERKTNEAGRKSFVTEIDQLYELVKRIDYRVSRAPHWQGKWRLTSFLQNEVGRIKKFGLGDPPPAPKVKKKRK